MQETKKSNSLERLGHGRLFKYDAYRCHGIAHLETDLMKSLGDQNQCILHSQLGAAGTTSFSEAVKRCFGTG